MSNRISAWVTKQRPDVIQAEVEWKQAARELRAYSDQMYATLPKEALPTAEYRRLDRIAYNARQHLRKVRGW